MRDKLTQKELKFSIAYASNGNATESAKLAGYAVPSASQAAHKLMRKGSVIREIEKRVEDFQLAQGITKSGILSDLIRLYNHALEAESHGVCKDILKLLGSEIGLFNEQKQVKHEHSVSFEQLLSASTTKDITPINQAITIN